MIVSDLNIFLFFGSLVSYSCSLRSFLDQKCDFAALPVLTLAGDPRLLFPQYHLEHFFYTFSLELQKPRTFGLLFVIASCVVLTRARQMDQEKQQACIASSSSRSQRFVRYCSKDIDKESAFGPLLAYTAIAGYASAVSFCSTWTYASFQSANSCVSTRVVLNLPSLYTQL